MRSISPELRNEILMMTREGHSVTEIYNVTGVSKGTIRKYQADDGSRSIDPTEHGGVVSKTIPVPKFEDKKKVEEEPLPVILGDQEIMIVGTETMTKFRAGMHKDVVTIEGDMIVGEIKIEKLKCISDELKGVYEFVKKMKANRGEII